jgi:hypothetical protein
VGRLLLYVCGVIVLGAFGFAVGARAPAAAPGADSTTDTTTTVPTPATTTEPVTTSPTTTRPAKRKRQGLAPVAASGPTSGGGFPIWAIAGVGLAALMIGGGATGMIVSRGRR